MISIDLDTLQFIIDKAWEYHAKEAVSIPEEPTSPTDDWARQVLADHVDDATYAELVAVIDDLEPDQQVDLVALMWLGRGDLPVLDSRVNRQRLNLGSNPHFVKIVDACALWICKAFSS